MPARLQRRRSTYRGATGTLIVGRDTYGRRVRVFVADTDDCDANDVVANIKAGRYAFEGPAD